MAGSYSQSQPISPPQVTNLLNHLLAQSKKVMHSPASISMFTTPKAPLVHLFPFEKLTLIARAESASAAPVSLDCVAGIAGSGWGASAAAEDRVLLRKQGKQRKLQQK